MDDEDGRYLAELLRVLGESSAWAVRAGVAAGRPVPLLRAHIKRYGTTPDGRIFQTTRGGVLQDSAYGEVWTEARKEAFTPAQYRSPLGRRPYDLRH